MVLDCRAGKELGDSLLEVGLRAGSVFAGLDPLALVVAGLHLGDVLGALHPVAHQHRFLAGGVNEQLGDVLSHFPSHCVSGGRGPHQVCVYVALERKEDFVGTCDRLSWGADECIVDELVVHVWGIKEQLPVATIVVENLLILHAGAESNGANGR